MKNAAAEPFCTNCETWKTSEDLGPLIGVDSNIVAALEAGELADLKPSDPAPIGSLLSMFECPNCKAESTIDVCLTQHTQNKKGEVSKKQLALVTYPGIAAESLRSIFAPSLAQHAGYSNPVAEATQPGKTQNAGTPAASDSAMRLTVISDYGKNEELISENATEADVVEQMKSLDWNGFNQVILQQQNGDLLEVGGGLRPDDGFSMIFNTNGEEFVVKDPPTTVEQMTQTLLLYLTKNETWKTRLEWE